MAVTSYGFTGAVNNVQWSKMASSLGYEYAALGAGDCKVSVVSTGTRTVRIAAGSLCGRGVLDVSSTTVDIALPSVASGSQWFMIIAKRVWQTTNATTFTYITGTATKQLPSRTITPGFEDHQPLALVRIQAGQALPQEVVDLRVVGANNGLLVAQDTLALQYLTSVGTVVRIGSVEWKRVASSTGVVSWVQDNMNDLGAVVRDNGNQIARLAPTGVYGDGYQFSVSNDGAWYAQKPAVGNATPVTAWGFNKDGLLTTGEVPWESVDGRPSGVRAFRRIARSSKFSGENASGSFPFYAGDETQAQSDGVGSASFSYDYGAGSAASAASDPARITFLKAGLYAVGAQCRLSIETAGRMRVGMIYSGALAGADAPSQELEVNAGISEISVSDTRYFAAGGRVIGQWYSLRQPHVQSWALWATRISD